MDPQSPAPQDPARPSNDTGRPDSNTAGNTDGGTAGNTGGTEETTRIDGPEHTTRFSGSSLPPYDPAWGTTPGEPTRPTGGRKRVGAAVLVGALVLGGAAGVGGAAAYHSFLDDTPAGTTKTAEPFQATKTALVNDGTVEKVASAVLPSVVKVNVMSQSGAGSGSGIVLSEDGDILTNNHVVAGAGPNGSITVGFQDGSTLKASVVGTDPLTDIAVIKAQGASGLTPASLGKSGELKVGQSVVAVGSPFGLNATVTSGIVSALNRPVSVSTEQAPQSPFGGQGGGSPQQSLSTTYPAIQTDAAINPGNSGGPLVDLSGRVVGINSSIRTSSGSGDAGGSIGLGFAIPIDEVLPIVNQITGGEAPTHARLGVSVSDVSGDSLNQGAELKSVEAGAAAEKAGLKVGDVITKVGDQPIDGSESLVATIRGHRPGDKVEVTYVRDGKTATTTADLGSDANNSSS